MKFNKYICVLMVFGLLINIGLASAAVTGGLGVGILPKISSISAGSQQTITIKIVSTQNIDDTVRVNLTNSGIPLSYQMDMSWFDWKEKTVNIPAGGTVQLQNNVTIPTGIAAGRKAFKVLVTSSRNIAASDTGIIDITLQPVDNTPPASVSDLHNVSFSNNYINWTWTDPADLDFDHVEVYLDNIFNRSVLRGGQFFNATGLTPDTIHIISTRTVDSNGNINQVWKNNTSRTAPEFVLVPGTPTNLANTTGAFWVNHTWSSGENTDSFNVSVNGNWDNSSNDLFRNTTSIAHSWVNITVAGYNSASHLLSGFVSQDTQIPNNPISITDIQDSYSLNEGQTLIIDANYTDADNDPGTFDRNFSQGMFDTSTGILSWLTGAGDAGLYNWQINVTDGYGSISTKEFTVTVGANTPGTPTNLDNTTGNFWVNHTWSSGANTDSFNVSINGNWDNSSAALFRNTSSIAHSWVNITVAGYNSASHLFSGFISQDTQIPNNPISITDIQDSYSLNEGQTLTIDANYTDTDGDMGTFTRDFSQGTFDPSSGILSWTTGAGDAGVYSWKINVTDGYGSVSTKIFTVTVATASASPPRITSFAPSSPVSNGQGEARLFNINANQTVNVTWYINGIEVFNQTGVTESIYINTSAAPGTWNVNATVLNSNGTDSKEWVWSVTSSELPPDPATVAPLVDTTVATNIATSTQFLYTGSNPIQTGVVPGTIEARRTVVLRGRVLDRDGNNLSGVNISILSHPEFGNTLSREDGMIDMVVNGGGLLTVNYEKEGYLTVQRQVATPWQDYVWLLDVVMIQVDVQVTTIDLSSSAPIQVAQGSLVTDTDGTRQTTVLFPQGIQASMTLPDGTMQPLTTMHVRATEYTVGTNGPQAMPAELPPTSGYTYAVELSVDEAMAAGARDVRFDKPVYTYVENFLDFPVGGIVPVGYYNRSLGQWIPSDNGRIIKILSITGGMAELDVNGSNESANTSQLTALNITDAERQQLATLYQPNQSLWRVPIVHFTPWDCNWPYGPPPDARPPNQSDPDKNDPPVDKTDKNLCGSVIGCQNQVLGETVNIAGTTFDLHYGSDRVPGYIAERALTIPLSGASIPKNLSSIGLRIEVAGRRFTQVFPAQPNLSYTFTWDGKDAYGRTLLGKQPITVRIGHYYRAVYLTPAQFGQAFGGYSSGTTGRSGGGGSGGGMGNIITPIIARQEISFDQVWKGTINAGYPLGQGIGGWNINVHHAYDSMGKTLYLGDGERRSAEALNINVIKTVAGGGSIVFDGGPAVKAMIGTPMKIALGPDGSIYIADWYYHKIRRVGPDGIITTVAGNGQICNWPCGDGGPATQAQLNHPDGIAVGLDGSIYISDLYSGRVRKVNPDGIISTVAGGGNCLEDYCALATQARITYPAGLALGPDGSLFIMSIGGQGIRKVGPDGSISTVAEYLFDWEKVPGNDSDKVLSFLNDTFDLDWVANATIIKTYVYGSKAIHVYKAGKSVDIVLGSNEKYAGIYNIGSRTYNLLAKKDETGELRIYASLLGDSSYKGISVGRDGSLYFPDINRIRRFSPDGILSNVAGNGNFSPDSDGILATHASIGDSSDVTLGPDGSLYIADGTLRIRRVSTDGIINTVAGNGTSGYSGDGGPATQAQLNGPRGVAVGPDDSIYIADLSNYRIRQVSLPLPWTSNIEIIVPSEDGSQLYTFNSAGRHLRTLDALTGALRYQFAYDGAGRLLNVTDADSNVLTIERDASGNATAIISPYGQRTTLALDSNGYLASITNPAGESNHLTYTADGLLTSMTTPRSNTYSFSYDALGRLIRDEDPAGGIKTLKRTDAIDGYSVTLATGLNRNTTYQVERLTTGDQRLVNTYPSGLKTEKIINTNGGEVNTYPDGMRTTLMQGPDPRFGMQAPVSKSILVKTPSGLTQNIFNERTAILNNSNDPLSLKTLTETASINGRTYTSTFNATTRNITSLTPLGRKIVTTLDNKGRVAEEQIPGVVPVRFTYDSRGRLSSITQGTRTSTFSYDAQGNLANVIDPLSRTAGFEYDTAGRVTKQTLTDGLQIQYAYDASGNIISITPPGKPDHAFNYTPVDLVENYLPPDIGTGTTLTRYTYNTDRQLTNVMRPDGASIDLGYDSAGRLSTIAHLQGIVNMDYDPVTGNLENITAADGGTITYDYDGSLLTDTIWSGSISGSVHRTYDNNFRITSESVNGTNNVNFQYDLDGLLTQAGLLSLSRNPQNGMLTGSALGNITDTIGYSSFGETTAYQAAYNGAGIFSVNYTRDVLGRIVQKNETIDDATHTYVYTYDQAGRLTNVSMDGVMVSQYAYDANGNRLSYTGSSGTISGSYDSQDRLLKYGTTTYTYTANGELLSKTNGSQTTTYQYDVLGNLRNVTLPDGTKIEYIIDGQNRRIGKKIDGILVQGFLYRDGLRPVAELDGAGNMVSHFVYASGSNVPDYMVRSGVTYNLVTDHMGSPRLVVDAATGAVAQRMDYDEFGNVTFNTNSTFQPFGFAGGIYDKDTKLIRFGARDYNAEIGRWTTKDRILFDGGDTNLYGYVLNDPVNEIDSLGMDSFGYDTEGEALIAALSEAWPSTRKTGKEYGGEIYKKNGKYFYNIREGTEGEVYVDKSNCPADSEPVSLYHTHPPNFEEYLPEIVSKDDKQKAWLNALKIYLNTPLGKLKQYDPNTGKTTSLGTSFY